MVLLVILERLNFRIMNADIKNGNHQSLQIGNQHWMLANLKVKSFANGDVIFEAQNGEEWRDAGEKGNPAWCYYNNASNHENDYGVLYNWYAVNDKRGLAPEGWSIPTDNDWTQLIEFLGGEEIAGKLMKSNTLWKDEYKGTNKSGFNGHPGGSRNFFGAFNFMGSLGSWWSADEFNDQCSWCRLLYGNYDYVLRNYVSKEKGFSVRCIKK